MPVPFCVGAACCPELPSHARNRPHAPQGPGGELLHAAVAGLLDDFNTPAAVSALSGPLKSLNDLLHTKAGKKAANRLQNIASYVTGLRQVLSLLGLEVAAPSEALAALRELALMRAGLSEADIAAAINERADARAAKDYAASDAVRARLAAVGVMIMDTPAGTTWRPGLPQEEAVLAA